MSEQHWSFTGIEAGSSAIQGAVQTTEGLLADGNAALKALAEVWGGSGSEAYQAVQRDWDTTSEELKNALASLAGKISDASQAMSSTESGVANMFGS